jgi:hypothetical protein
MNLHPFLIKCRVVGLLVQLVQRILAYVSPC